MSIQSIQLKKDWRSWGVKEFGNGCALEENLEQSILFWLRDTKNELGPALSFENKFSTEEEVFHAINKTFEFLDMEIFLAIVGDADAPIIFLVPKAKLFALITKAFNEKKPWSLSSVSDRGHLLICPEVESSEKELLISASGVFESVIERMNSIFPNGITFRGN